MWRLRVVGPLAAGAWYCAALRSSQPYEFGRLGVLGSREQALAKCLHGLQEAKSRRSATPPAALQ